ncbi:hypothetical protein AB0I60_30125 [Actinosynnema sp. NPDC050436]|uniref:hypothetical protein n=1 Tax=Actinosynnema sp. NPDC050436 TaxID=3155659 RepID=UPI0033C75356
MGTVMVDVGTGLVPAALCAVLAVGLGVFLLACRLAAGGPVRAARRTARWRRAAPWVLAVAAVVFAVDVGWALLSA